MTENPTPEDIAAAKADIYNDQVKTGDIVNPIEALRASGLKVLLIDEDTDIGEQMHRAFETNEEFIVRIMNVGCPTGPMIQGFVMEALGRYADDVAALEKEPEGRPGMLSFDAWKATAVWLKAELEKKRG